MSFTSEYLKLRKNRSGQTTNQADGTAPSAAAGKMDAKAGTDDFSKNYLALREQRTTGGALEKQETQNETIAGRVANRVMKLRRNQQSHAGTAGTTTGSYYSRGALEADGEKLYSAVSALEPTLTEKRQTLTASQESAQQAHGDLETVKKALEQAQAAYNQNPDSNTAKSYNEISDAYKLALDNYNTAYDAYTAAYNAYRSSEDQYVDALANYQFYTEKNTKKWKGTIRDAATIQSQIQAVDQQIADLKKLELRQQQEQYQAQ